MILKTFAIITFFVFFIIFPSLAQQNTQSEILTNYSIMNMAKKGLSNSIILLKIKQTPSNFDVSTDAIVFLKESKITDDVILAMIEKSTQVSNANTTPLKNQYNSPSSNTESKKINPQALSIIENLNGSGIYFFNEESNTYIQVDPTVVSGAQAKLNTGAYLGIGGASVSKSFVDGKEANLQIANTRKPIFYFYFDSASTSLNNSNNKVGQLQENFMDKIYGYGNTMNSKAFTPNDFKLINLDISKNSRYFKGGKISGGGSTTKISSGYFVTYKYERLSSNLFKVYFPENLDKSSEYCFLYAGNTSNNNGSGFMNDKTEIKVFDFGTKYKKKK